MVSDGIIFIYRTVLYGTALEAVTEKEIAFWAVWLTGCCVILVSYLAGVTFLSPSILIIYLPYYTVAYFVGRHREFVETYAPLPCSGGSQDFALLYFW